MSEQLLLLDVPAARLPEGNWFFALRPGPDSIVSQHLDRLCTILQAQHALSGPSLGADRFHISLHPLRGQVCWRHDLIAAACETVAETTAPFEVTFDRVENFPGRFGKRALVLRAAEGLDALLNFRQRLGAGLTRGGLGRFEAGTFTPHITLLYDRRAVGEQKVDPVAWTITEFFLVQSLVGESQHIVQGHWPLRG